MQGAECKCHRLAISLNETLANSSIEANFRRGIQSITADECAKASRFRYKDDALASVLGRLFLRQAARRLSNVEWHTIEFDRTEKGKPYLKKPENVGYGLNVSHQGDYVALASSCSSLVGVDCMRLDKERNNKSADDYITSMAKSASPDELRTMRTQPTEQMKMTYFYRYWCLKEAVLKATGEGLLSDLSRLNFHLDISHRYKPRCFITSTTVFLDNQLQDEWIFEESFIDDRHNVAVCREKKLPNSCVLSKKPDTELHFGVVNIDFLLEGATVLNILPEDGSIEWTNFNSKPRKPF